MTKQRKLRAPSEGERASALEALLARPTATWGEVMNRLAPWPDTPGRLEALAAVEAVAERWPPEARGLTPLAEQQIARGEFGPYLRLVRNLDLRTLGCERRRDRLFEQMIRKAGLTRLDTFTTRYDWGDQLVALLARHVSGLRHLMIGASALGDDGARALAAAPALGGLLRLSLYGNCLTDAGAEALVESPYLRQLRSLNLYGNRLSGPMVERLRAAPHWQGVTLVLHNQRSGEGVDYRIPSAGRVAAR